MEIKPIKDIENPKYPLKEEMSEKTLMESVPKRWTGSKAAKVALGTLTVVTLAGCYAGAPMPPSIVSEGSCLTDSSDISVFTGSPVHSAINIAPLFVHGNGSGAFGCVMVAPPVFLSEEDALTVINETAKEYGLNFSSEDTPEFSNVRQPVTNLGFNGNSPKPSQQGDTISFKTDFADSKHSIAIEFVSVDDVKKWSSGPSSVSAESYDTKDAAEQLSEALEESDYRSNYTAAVLYDPCEYFQPENITNQADQKKAQEKAMEMSEVDLKAQAKDFFDWLKSQGII